MKSWRSSVGNLGSGRGVEMDHAGGKLEPSGGNLGVVVGLSP